MSATDKLFDRFPRPWRACERQTGVVLAADGKPVVTVDQLAEHPEGDVIALASLLCRIVNTARV